MKNILSGILMTFCTKILVAQDYQTKIEMPTFPGGQENLKEFISQHLIYPEDSKNRNIEGVVFVRFVVNKDGGLSSPEILIGLDIACNQEALRLIDIMPKWVPSKVDGVPTERKYTLPINFVIK